MLIVLSNHHACLASGDRSHSVFSNVSKALDTQSPAYCSSLDGSVGYLLMKGWVSFFLQLQCSSCNYPGLDSYSLELICPTKEKVSVPSATSATRFNNGVRTQHKPCLFVGVDIQGLMTVCFLKPNF